VAEGFMLDNPLLVTIGSLIGVSGSILSYIMVRKHSTSSFTVSNLCGVVRCNESFSHERAFRRNQRTSGHYRNQDRGLYYSNHC